MAPPPSRNLGARGSSGTSALAHITNAFMGSLHLQRSSKSARVLTGAKAKVHIDNRPSSRRSMHRTSGRNGDNDALAGGAVDPLRARKISIRERSTGRAGADSMAVDIANAAIVGADVQGPPPGAPRRPTMLGATQNDGFSESLRTLKARILGENGSDKDLARKRDSKEVQFDYIDGGDGGNDSMYIDEDDEFGDEEEDPDDPQTKRMRALAAAEQDELAYFSQRGSSFDFKVGRRWVLHPYGRARAAWDCFLLCIVTWMLITTPFELSFRELSLTTRRVILSIDYFLDVMFVGDIILNFMTAVEFDGRLHFSYGSIRRHYLGGWFVVDALWTMPFYTLTGTTGADVPAFMSMGHFFKADLYPLLRIFRLGRIISLARIRRRLEFSLRISSSSSSLGGFVYLVMALSHLFSCMFAYLAFGDEYHLGLALADNALEDDSIFSRYIASSYWAMMTIATVGYGDLTVKTNAGRIFSIVAMVMGGGIFAYGISNVVDLFQQLYVEETEHRHKMDQVNTFMHHRALPRKFRDEIRANFFHLRKATRENKIEDRAIVFQMSRTMQSRVADLFCLDMMPTHMPTLAGCNAEFIHELYLAMEVQCYLPGEDIIRQDEFGSEMYFLFVGHVQVFVGHSKVALFGPNTCFGEFAIMNPRRPRLATIQAMDFCETHCISRAKLLATVMRHPFMLRSIRQLVQLKQRKALAILTDQTTKTRTLIQSLAVVWHTDGFQALLPPGLKVEDAPELQQFAAAERAFSPLARLASMRMGLGTTGRRKSVSMAAAVEVASAVNAGALAMAPTSAATSRVDTMSRRRSSIHAADTASISGGAEPSVPVVPPVPVASSPTARVRRTAMRLADGGGETSARYASGALTAGGGGGGGSADDRVSLLLHQMSVMLKRQEKLEKQVQQLLETRQHRGSVHVSYPSAAVASPDPLRARTSVTDLAKVGGVGGVGGSQESPL